MSSYVAYGMAIPLLVWLIVVHRIRVVIAQSPHEGFVAVVGKKALRIFGIRLVLVVESHGDFESSFFSRYRGKLRGLERGAKKWIAEVAIRNSDVFRAISRSTAGQLQSRRPEKPTIIFPAWIDLEVFRAEPTRHHGEKENELRILFAGGLHPVKGVDHLIRAFAQLAQRFPNVELIVAGQPVDLRYEQEIQTLSSSLGLNHRIQFTGHVPQIQLAALMSQSFLLVLPSLSEGLGRVLIESMATGTPVIASRVGGIMDIVEDGETGLLVTPGDVSELRDALRWALENRKEMLAMGELGRSRVVELLSVESYVDGYRQILDAAQDIIETSA